MRVLTYLKPENGPVGAIFGAFLDDAPSGRTTRVLVFLGDLRESGEVGERRGGAPVVPLLRPYEIGLPDPAHLRLREAGAAAEALP